MKHLRVLIGFMILTIIVVYACSDTRVVEGEIESTGAIADFSRVGEVHNEGLDFIFSKRTLSKLHDIGNKGRNTEIDSVEVLQLIFEETNLFIQTQTVIVDGVEVHLNPISSVEEFLEIYNMKELGVYNEVDTTLEKYEVVEQIDSIMDDYLIHPERLDYNIVMNTGSVFKNSIEYWSDEENRQADFSNYQTKGWFSWISFAISDAQGAYGGASVGSVGGPIGAIGGAIAFGLMSSAFNAAIQAAVHVASS